LPELWRHLPGEAWERETAVIKIEINGNVLTVQLDDEQLETIKKTFEDVTAKEIRRQIRKVMKEEAKK